ncbi:MAG: hypothetical protein MK116_12940 [Phycisphaerales bacterium]|nr:hypothetical protein [Phycisphaerales bacterium]
MFDSVARRDSYFPSEGPARASFDEDVASKLPDAWSRFWEMCDSVEFTDYIVMYSTPRSPGVQSLYGVHDIVLADGTTPGEFEAFVDGPFAAAWPHSIGGMGRAILVGDRGARAGEYQNVFIFTPASKRDEFFPTPTTQSDVYNRDVAPKLRGEIGEAMQRMTDRESYSDWAPVRR